MCQTENGRRCGSKKGDCQCSTNSTQTEKIKENRTTTQESSIGLAEIMGLALTVVPIGRFSTGRED